MIEDFSTEIEESFLSYRWALKITKLYEFKCKNILKIGVGLGVGVIKLNYAKTSKIDSKIFKNWDAKMRNETIETINYV